MDVMAGLVLSSLSVFISKSEDSDCKRTVSMRSFLKWPLQSLEFSNFDVDYSARKSRMSMSNRTLMDDEEKRSHP